MFPQLTPSKRTRSREESTHFTRIKHALSTIANNARKHEQSHDKNHFGGDIDETHYGTHSTVQSYISNLRLKFRRMNASSSSTDTKGIFSFRALDGKRPKLARAVPSDSFASDHYVFGNAQTISNDSTDHRLIRMLVEKAPSLAANPSMRRRSSFGSIGSLNFNLLSAAPPHYRAFRRYSMAGSDLTVASEDLTAREFAEHLGINVYPEEEEEVFGSNISILFQQHRMSANGPQSTVLSSTRSTKSKISIMEDSFWMPPTNDSDRSDEEGMPRSSSESAEVYLGHDGIRERRNSLITFADGSNMCKHKRQASSSAIAAAAAAAVRPGRHSAPIPIPAPKPILVQQGQLPRENCSPKSETLFSVSSESANSSFTTGSTMSSVSTTITIPSQCPPSPKRTDCLETPQIFAIIKNGLALESTTEGSNFPFTVKKGRFEITLGDAPPSESCSSRLSIDGGSNSPTPSSASTSTEESNFVVFQRRRFRVEGTCDDNENCRPPYENERRRSLSMSVIE